MTTLRITQTTESTDRYRVELSLDGDGFAPQGASASFPFEVSPRDQEDLRWYLEDYLQFPHDPAPTIAARIEQRMTEIGIELFNAVFDSSTQATRLWAKVYERASDLRVEIVTSVREAAAVPWEMLRDPHTDTVLALRAAAFVRTHREAVVSPKTVEAASGPIRILLVICRPKLGDDVPFPSVASRLVKALTNDARDVFQLDVLRPPTYDQFAKTLRQAKRDGLPYHVVHFDGHGMYAELSENDGAEAASAWLKKLIPLMLSGPREGSHGYLLFENPANEQNLQLVDGDSLGKLLYETNTPVLVLNACRSAHADVAEQPEHADSSDEMHAQVRAFGSLAQEVIDAGVTGVVAMRYNVYVVTATQEKSFGEMNFGHAELGDKRRTKRLVKLADQMCLRPGGSLPQKLRSPADLHAFYRLMDKDDVTHQAILDSHRQATLQRMKELEGPVLVLHDTTELEYTTRKSLTKLGQIGNGNRRGYITHNSLAVDPATKDVIGLCNQVLHRRPKVSKSETRAQRNKRKSRESLLWIQGTESLPADPQIVDVCDRGADTAEFIEHEMNSGRRFVIRASHDRCILIGHGGPEESASAKLKQYASTLPQAGTWTLRVTSKSEMKSPNRKGKKKLVKRIKREAEMAVAFASVQINPSKPRKDSQSMKVWIVRVWELDPPQGQERLEWILITNEPVGCFEAAYRVVGWYECRWIIEEYHKGQKTGCRTEDLQFTSEDRLQPAIALLSVVTLTLLQLRQASRRPDAQTRKATTIIDRSYVEVLSIWRHKTIKRDWTVHEFYYALARLGGHQNRKHDHPPGWQVLWEGWKELLPMVIGYDVAKSKYKKCG